MRTTIDINDELLRAAKRRGAEERRTLREVVEAALRTYLGKPVRRRGYRMQWRPEAGRLQPGVRLDDRDALWDLMEGRR
jgi:Arc/MetJ family transcription regulator